MRISDWSSDVCSSDLVHRHHRRAQPGDGAIGGRRGAIADLEQKSAPIFDCHGLFSLRKIICKRGVAGCSSPACSWLPQRRRQWPRPPTRAKLSPNASAPISKSRSKRKRPPRITRRSEEHTSELQSLMRISYAVFCLKKK